MPVLLQWLKKCVVSAAYAGLDSAQEWNFGICLMAGDYERWGQKKGPSKDWLCFKLQT